MTLDGQQFWRRTEGKGPHDSVSILPTKYDGNQETALCESRGPEQRNTKENQETESRRYSQLISDKVQSQFNGANGGSSTNGALAVGYSM